MGTKVEGRVFTGSGTDVLRAVAQHAGVDSLQILSNIIHQLLVPKGTDWTSVIQGEYLQVYPDSFGTFSLVWDDLTHQLVAHGSTFQSTRYPWVALLAHIRTIESHRGLGLGSLVTEQVTERALQQGAGVVVLATDDKLHRLNQGERAAHSMYSRLGYAVLGEKRLADTVDWLMAINEPLRQLSCTQANDSATQLATAQHQCVADIQHAYLAKGAKLTISPVNAGDLPALFLLCNLCPEDDYQLKLASWDVHLGPELERTFITVIRQAIVDQDRLHDASQVIRDECGRIVGVCAMRQLSPFTRQTFAIDCYAMPEFVQHHPALMKELVESAIQRVREGNDSIHT
ncbi:GNAT family N-acetyltransferase [Aeoliella mucimassa]|uniref:GNAT family N-acetyltransferase n=1 Tax=Aeoliella mucimassa TaxID=2527972 RepID=UPI001E4941AC|nr:GNAT family N-acetyltransferase [Aeoliella mucimassa]